MVNYSAGQMSGRQFFWGGNYPGGTIVREAIVLGAIFLGEIVQGVIIWGQLSGGQLSCSIKLVTKIKKRNQLYFGTLVLASYCYCGDNE